MKTLGIVDFLCHLHIQGNETKDSRPDIWDKINDKQFGLHSCRFTQSTGDNLKEHSNEQMQTACHKMYLSGYSLLGALNTWCAYTACIATNTNGATSHTSCRRRRGAARGCQRCAALNQSDVVITGSRTCRKAYGCRDCTERCHYCINYFYYGELYATALPAYMPPTL